PRLAVLGLNPHAGEGGLLGDEEREEIAPAVDAARRAGMNVDGPLPADSAFAPAVRDRYDAHVAMYHDQGLGPFKTLSFGRGVNVTLGIPIVRTSVDHGTAFDIAWQGKASAESLVAAVQLAVKLTANR
ncbi:MAG: PdxA family dehydrogenase, partial [Planctomycetota bacterium]